MTDDAILLHRYAAERSEDAFAELVRRHVDLVYAAALRRTNGDTHRAADATQQVFVSLARHAASLASHTVLAGWLYTATRNATLNLLREETRRQAREQEAFTMHELSSRTEPEADWRQLRPVLDAAMDELEAADREALLVRFFQGRPLAEVGAALHVSEDAARKRVDRALDKLRERLTRRGITSTAVALGAVLAAQPVVVAPAGLAASLLAPALAGAAMPAAGVTSAWAALDFMLKLKLASIAAAALAAVGTVTYVLGQQNEKDRAAVTVNAGHAELASLRAENERLKSEIGRLQKAVADAAPSPLAELRAVVAAAQQKVIGPLAQLLRLDQENHLSPGVAGLFALTADEKSAVEKGLVSARDAVNTLAADNVAVVEHPRPASMVIRLKAFPQEGGKIHDRFVGELAAALGTERFEAVKTLMRDHFDFSIAGGFGLVERSITIDRQGGGAPGQPAPRYIIVDRTQSPPGPSGTPTASLANVTQADRATLEQSLSVLVKLLPSDF